MREDVIIQRCGRLYLLGNRCQAIAVDLEERSTSDVLSTQSFLAHCHVNEQWVVIADHGRLPKLVRAAIERFRSHRRGAGMMCASRRGATVTHRGDRSRAALSSWAVLSATQRLVSAARRGRDVGPTSVSVRPPTGQACGAGWSGSSSLPTCEGPGPRQWGIAVDALRCNEGGMSRRPTEHGPKL